jgi:hypothetical protein
VPPNQAIWKILLTSAVAFLVNPSNAPYTENETTEVRNAAASLGLQLNILKASTIAEIDTAFVTLGQVRAGALLVSAEGLFGSRREQIITLATRDAIPAIYNACEFPEERKADFPACCAGGQAGAVPAIARAIVARRLGLCRPSG